ncbi:MAG: hypothetical protein FJX76_23645 [Armatimonadetes bacterium]|nr:hypothetical protein [Armatimonadota bacterium]
MLSVTVQPLPRPVTDREKPAEHTDELLVKLRHAPDRATLHSAGIVAARPLALPEGCARQWAARSIG